MLLFSKSEDKSAVNAKVFHVVSPDVENLQQISQLVKLAGFEQIETFCQPLTESLTLPANSRGVVVDIGPRDDADNIISQIQAQVPRDAWCCVVGDSDSISLAQTFMAHGIHYFNLNAQREALLQTIASGQQLRNTRSALCISVLGCKGGVGATTVAWSLISRMAELRASPMLFIQGAAGAHDLDLIIGKKMTQDIVSVSKHLDAMSWREPEFVNTSRDVFSRYNFVVYEETVCAADKEHIRQIIDGSSCLILMLERSMSSIRMVRQVSEMIESINRNTAVPRRLILCLNDSRPVKLGMLEVEDIQELLGRKLDLIIPYGKTKRSASLLSRWSKPSPQELLTLRVLGESPEQKKPTARARLKKR